MIAIWFFLVLAVKCSHGIGWKVSSRDSCPAGILVQQEAFSAVKQGAVPVVQTEAVPAVQTEAVPVVQLLALCRISVQQVDITVRHLCYSHNHIVSLHWYPTESKKVVMLRLIESNLGMTVLLSSTWSLDFMSRDIRKKIHLPYNFNCECIEILTTGI